LRHVFEQRSGTQSRMMDGANSSASSDCAPTSGDSLCSFCRARIYEFSKLGWKQKTNVRGDLFFEPATITLPNGDVEFKPFKDEGAFGPYNDFPTRYKPLYTDVPTKGVHIYGRTVKLEFYRSDLLPDCPALTASGSAGCTFCAFLQQLIRNDTSCQSEYAGYTIFIWSISFSFEPRVEISDRSDFIRDSPKLSIKSLKIEYQPKISVKEFEVSIAAIPGS